MPFQSTVHPSQNMTQYQREYQLYLRGKWTNPTVAIEPLPKKAPKARDPEYRRNYRKTHPRFTANTTCPDCGVTVRTLNYGIHKISKRHLNAVKS